MKVEATTKFRDLEKDCIRKAGDKFDVTKERYEVLRKRGFVKKIEEPKEEAAK